MIRGRNSARHTLLAIGFLALSGSFGSQARAGIIYNAVNDFSLASNPNGVWSYGSLSALSGGNFTTINSTLINASYTGQNAWYNGLQIPNAIVVDKNTSGVTQTFQTVTLPATELRLDGESGIADVRWTAPTAGSYSIAGLFQRIDNGNVPVSVRVLLNGVALFSVDNFSTFNAQQAFNLANLTLKAGDVLDFAEGAPQFNNDSTGLSVTIIPNTVPEPSSLALLGCGILGVLLKGWRQRRRLSLEPA
jgi:PEP-CTERM motif